MICAHPRFVRMLNVVCVARCVVDWFGTWSLDALAQVGHEFTHTLDTSFTDYKPPIVTLSGGRAGVSDRSNQ